MNLTEELLASALPLSVHHQLQYREVTAAGAFELTGHRHAGWVVPMNGPDGKPYRCQDGKTFYRLKPTVPVMGKDGKAAKYLTPRGAGCRPYLSPLLPKRHWNRVGIRTIQKVKKKAIPPIITASPPSA